MSIDLQRLSDAEKLLWGYGVTEPDHIDLDAIAFDLGAKVVYRALEGCEARLVAGDARAIISLSSTSNLGRQRFSLGHELAHWICDRSTGYFQCAKEDISPQDFEAKTVEARANGYASQLVLPDYLVDSWRQGRQTSMAVADQLAHDFKSSLTAAAIRLVKGSTTPACLACHTQTGLGWYQRSSRFPSDFHPIRDLHYETDAFQMAFQRASGISRPKRSPADRWILGRDTHRLEATAQSVNLAEGTVLTLFTLGA